MTHKQLNHAIDQATQRALKQKALYKANQIRYERYIALVDYQFNSFKQMLESLYNFNFIDCTTYCDYTKQANECIKYFEDCI